MVLATTQLPALSRLLDQVLDLDDSQIEPWLAGLDAADLHLAPVLRQVLSSRARVRTSELLSAWAAAPAAASYQLAAAGEWVGPYRLLRELGRGGMGVVWLAERADGNFERQVAVKLPRLMWDDRLAERMAREWAIGAMLEHPNIARLYDAGIDLRGRPFLAMELIDGQSIDAWCRERALPSRERLRLMVQVMRAVSYAHGRLVVHRDIKPSNVLVSPDGQAHLLDFGIAKLLDSADVQGSAGRTDFTQEPGRLMTPQYASPEQVGGQLITVASDVYSLGALLYELLTGRCPYVLKRNTADAMEDAILQGEPELASSRAATPALARELRGDLDAILGKALKRDPAERYATAEALASDIERHLRCDVVLARPDSWSYRAIKTARRRAVAIGASGLVLLAVLVGAAMVWVQAQRANLEADRARLVKEFVVDIFSTQGGQDGSLGQMPGHALLERSAALIATKFVGQPLLQAELYAVVSDMFFNIANNLQAVNYAELQVQALKRGAARPADMARALLRVVDFLIPMDVNDTTEARAREALGLALASGDTALTARAHASLAQALMYVNKDLAAARVEIDAAQAALVRGPAVRGDIALVNFALANWLAFSRDVAGARIQFDETITAALADEGSTSRLALNARLEAAKTLFLDDQNEAGNSYLQAALHTMRIAGGANDVNAALWESRGAFWMFFNDALPFAETSATFERNLASLRTQTWSLPDKYIDRMQVNYGKVLIRWGNIEQGLALVLQHDRASSDRSPVGRWWTLHGNASALMPSERSAEVPAIVREMLALQQSWQRPDDLRKTYHRLVLALVYAQRHETAGQALAEYLALPDVAADAALAPTSDVAPPTSRLLLALETGRYDNVVKMTAGLKQKPGIHTDEAAWLARAAALCATGAVAEADSLFNEWLPRLAHDRFEANPHLVYWRARMGLCALAGGHRQRAQQAWSLASAALKRQPGVSQYFKAPVTELGRRLQP